MTETARALDASTQEAGEEPTGRPPAKKRTSWLLTVDRPDLVVYFLLPLWWLLVASTKSNADLFSSFGLWFSNFNLIDNIKTVLTFQDGVYRPLGGELGHLCRGQRALGASFLATMAGYAFAKYKFPGGTALFSIILGSVMVPVAALTVPTYLLFARAQITDTYWAVILPALATPFGVFLMRVYAADAVDTALIEAGRVDGVGEIRIFFTHRVPAVDARIGHRAAVRPGGELEQLLPAADHAELHRRSSHFRSGWRSGQPPRSADPARRRCSPR